MSMMNISNEELVRLVTKLVVEQLTTKELKIPMGVSNRHVHLDRKDMDILFGPGSELTKVKDLGQPGQYACEEMVVIKGPKGQIGKVRVLGPLRPETQIEISKTDSFTLGVKAPVRESGVLAGTPGIELVGPCGTVKKDQGVIIALRHIHMTPEIAKVVGLKDKDIVNVEVGGERGGVMRNVLVRVSDKYALEMHVDVDEANGLGLKNNDYVTIVK